MPDSQTVVAVLDSDPDTLELLKTVLETDGFLVATGDLNQFRTGNDDLFAFVDRTHPDVIVFDLALPYESNWEYLRRAREHPGFSRPALVITTTNQPLVHRLLGAEDISILGKPYDVERLTEAVRAAIAPDSSGLVP